MPTLKSLILLSTLLLASTALFADVINLKDGTILEGQLVGRDNGIIMFRVNGEIRAFPEDDVAALVQEEQSSSAPTPQATLEPAVFTVPAGTRLVISMLEDVDTRQHKVGHQFRAQLESALVVDGVTVVPRGTVLHGTVRESEQARRAVGRSELSMEFTDILLNDQLYPIATGELQLQGRREGGQTLRRAARGALLGGLIDGGDGARTGAQVGAGVSLLTRGENVNVTRGTILETELRVPISFRQ